MLSLADTQRLLRRAVVTGDTSQIMPLLTGGRDTEKRLAIHRRQYETSLVTALLGKFPATTWLIGPRFIADAAQRFVYEYPPEAPCIAEYGEQFPRFIAACPLATRVPYLGDFAELEWHIGQISIAVDRPPLSAEHFSGIGEKLMEAVLTMQGGVRYLPARWPIDDLMKLYLTDVELERLTFEPADVWIEIRGARGAFQINRLDADEFSFRKMILDGRTIGEAAECALEVNPEFAPGLAIVKLVVNGLVIAVTPAVE